MTEENRSILGTGPIFPYNQSKSGGLDYNADIPLIDQSLFILFETEIGSRLMLPNFGSTINKFRFDPLDKILLDNLRYAVTEDIRKWEPRIRLVSVDFLATDLEIDNSTIYISITYSIINTNVTHNYVYPYKRKSYDVEYANSL